jgi:hypothetical protein
MSDSERPTAPPPPEDATATRQMPPFQLAVALAKAQAVEESPPSLLVPSPSTIEELRAKTPLVELTKSDVERLEADSVDLGWDAAAPQE